MEDAGRRVDAAAGGCQGLLQRAYRVRVEGICVRDLLAATPGALGDLASARLPARGERRVAILAARAIKALDALEKALSK